MLPEVRIFLNYSISESSKEFQEQKSSYMEYENRLHITKG
jgi:hypothetical protein